MIRGNVAIVGRPNVGKSTLFNKLTGSRKSIISDKNGVTRDFLVEILRLEEGKECLLYDTGGYETKDINFQPFSDNLVWQQTKYAIEKADVVIFLLDGKAGLQPFDKDLLNYLLKEQKPLIPVINKIDGIEKESLTWEFCELRVDSFLKISAAHKRGLLPLREAINDKLDSLPLKSKAVDEKKADKLALIGRPNAGKSSILNRILGEPRALVSEISGTTRDSVDSFFAYNNKDYKLIDTAGIRRRTKIKEDLEKASIIKSIENIEQADLVLFILDATEQITDQDIRLINLAVRRYKPILLVVNKWDLIENKGNNTQQKYKEDLKFSILKDLSYLPIHFISCKHNLRVHKIMPYVEKLLEQTQKKVKTAALNEFLQETVKNHSPRIMKHLSKRTKFYYAAQIRTSPPTIVIKCNVAKDLQSSYKKYLMRSIKKEVGLEEIPIKIIYEGKDKEKEKARAKEASKNKELENN